MLVSRRTENRTISPLIQIGMGMSGGMSGGLGVDWSLVLQVGGWVINGIGLGMSVHESIYGAADKTGIKPGDLSTSDISSLATMIAAKDPQGRSAQQWQTDLSAMLGTGAGVPPTPQICPAGFYRDPATGACIPLKTAGFFEDMSTGKVIGLGVAGVLLAKMLKLI